MQKYVRNVCAKFKVHCLSRFCTGARQISMSQKTFPSKILTIKTATSNIIWTHFLIKLLWKATLAKSLDLWSWRIIEILLWTLQILLWTVEEGNIFAFQFWYCELSLKNHRGGDRRPNFISLVVWSDSIGGAWVVAAWSRNFCLWPAETASFVCLVLFKNRWRRVSPTFHLFVSDINQGN